MKPSTLGRMESMARGSNDPELPKQAVKFDAIFSVRQTAAKVILMAVFMTSLGLATGFVFSRL
jgi:hypothetical protein